jgi:threonine synthase
MDIQVASNFERLLFDMEGHDGARVRELMQGFREAGSLRAQQAAFRRVRELFAGGRADEATTAATIRRTLETTGELVDPHTAVGLAVAARERPPAGIPLVTLATAHPAKFADAVHEATGIEPHLPPAFGDLHERPERCLLLPNDLGVVEAGIRDTLPEAA